MVACVYIYKITSCTYAIVSINIFTIPGEGGVCSDLRSKEPHRHIGAGKVVTSRSLADVMVSTLAQIATYVGSNPSLFTRFDIFISPTTISRNLVFGNI